ncbi:PIN domain-containing protein [Capnocytophaga sp. oral taxon 332]|uniref:PIN domain-containing protein n=1 Tax=Capnocytophaga sp. oral taxon 332 TaxID=712213 RepID=UPI00034BE8C0|nr:PIN domain-containing protein [Capnocytophaga sp. oral taxon 332]
MIVISDSNIIFSCFYSPKGTIATILNEKKRKIQLIAPSYLLEEIKEHLPLLVKNTKKTEKQVLDILKNITKDITFYDKKDILKEYGDKAESIVGDIDIDDAPFVALHLQEGHKIWTGDKILINGLKEKGYDICITTEELKKYLYKKVE